MKKLHTGREKLHLFRHLPVIGHAGSSQREPERRRGQTWRKPDKGQGRDIRTSSASLGKENFLKNIKLIVEKSCSENQAKLGRDPE